MYCQRKERQIAERYKERRKGQNGQKQRMDKLDGDILQLLGVLFPRKDTESLLRLAVYPHSKRGGVPKRLVVKGVRVSTRQPSRRSAGSNLRCDPNEELLVQRLICQ